MENISDITECCICAEMFTDPRMLPCVHTFCLKCLEETRSTLSENKNSRDSMPCPICRQQFTVPPEGLIGLRKNFFMDRLMEIAKISKPLKSKVSCDVCLLNRDESADDEVHDASRYCVECQENMCDMCSAQHKRQKLSRAHQIVAFRTQLSEELVKTSTATYCSRHKKDELRMYCADCKKVICMMCFAESHKYHDCSDVNNVAKAFRKEIDIFIETVVDGSKQGLSREFKLEEEKRKFIEESEIVETVIKDHAKELKQVLDDLVDKHSQLLLDELVQRKAKRMIETEVEIEEIRRHLTIVDSFKSYCSELKSKGTSTDICRSVHDLRSRAGELRDVFAAKIKQDFYDGCVSFQPSAIEDYLMDVNMVGSLEGQMKPLTSPVTIKELQGEHKSPETPMISSYQRVSVKLVKCLRCLVNIQAVTKVDDRVYVLSQNSLSPFETTTVIRVFHDPRPLRCCKTIEISEISSLRHVVPSNKLKCLFLLDSNAKCIWKLTVDDFRLAQWLSVSSTVSLSISNDENVLLLRDGEDVCKLEIYGCDANIIRSISLPHNIASPLHVTQETNGLFILIHKSYNSLSGSWEISELSSEGEMLRQLHPTKVHKNLGNPYDMFFDSKQNQLFVALEEKSTFRVVIFDLVSFKLGQVILSSGIRLFSLHFDERKKELLAGKSHQVNIYHID